METIVTKKCTTCKERKSLDKFSKSKNRWDGLNPVCKPCDSKKNKKYYKTNHEKQIAKFKKYREEMGASLRNRLKDWQRKNKDKVKNYYYKYLGKDGSAEKIKAQQKRWRDNNKERTAIKVKKWADENKDKRALTAEKRRVAKVNNGGTILASEWRALKEFYGNKCLCCGRTDATLTLDHVIPISKGGTHTIDNAQPLCGSCNSSKHTKIIDYRPK